LLYPVPQDIGEIQVVVEWCESQRAKISRPTAESGGGVVGWAFGEGLSCESAITSSCRTHHSRVSAVLALRIASFHATYNVANFESQKC